MLGIFSTAIRTFFAKSTEFRTVFTRLTLFTKRYTRGTVFLAFHTKRGSAIRAVITLSAHCIRTIGTNSAIGANFTLTFGTNPTTIAKAFRTIQTDQSAIGTNIGTFSTSAAFLTPVILSYAFAAKITGNAEIVIAFRTMLKTFLTKVITLNASISADASNCTVGTEHTIAAPSVRLGAGNTFTAAHAKLIRTILTSLVAFRANDRTFRTPLSAIAYIFGAIYTGLTVIAEVSISTDTVLADVAASAYLFVRAVCTLFVTIRANCCAFRASVTAIAYIFGAIYTGLTVVAEASFSPRAIFTNVTSRANSLV